MRSLKLNALALIVTGFVSGTASAKNVTVDVGRVGAFQILRTFDDQNGSHQYCSAKIVSSGREFRFYQSTGNGFGVHFKGSAATVQQYIHIAVARGGSHSYDAVAINGGWYRVSVVDAGLINLLRQPQDFMEVQFMGTKTKYSLKGQNMSAVFKAIADCKPRP